MNVEVMFGPLEQNTSPAEAFSKWQDDLRGGMHPFLACIKHAQMAPRLVAALAAFGRYVEAEDAKVSKALAQGGWIGLERHFYDSEACAALRVCRTEGEAAMNEAILAHFSAENSARLVDIVNTWDAVPYLHARQAIVRDALSAHRAGQFTLSIPALLPLAEGLSAEVLGVEKTNAVQLLALDWNAREKHLDARLSCELVQNVIYKKCTFGKDPIPYLNRHGILHGRDPNYDSELNSARVFLLVDTIADLWNAKQRAISSKRRA